MRRKNELRQVQGPAPRHPGRLMEGQAYPSVASQPDRDRGSQGSGETSPNRRPPHRALLWGLDLW